MSKKKVISGIVIVIILVLIIILYNMGVFSKIISTEEDVVKDQEQTNHHLDSRLDQEEIIRQSKEEYEENKDKYANELKENLAQYKEDNARFFEREDFLHERTAFSKETIDALKKAKKKDLLPTRRQIDSHVRVQKDLYVTDKDYKEMIDDLMVHISEEDYWDQVAIHDAIGILTLQNLANHELEEKGAKAFYGHPTTRER